MYASKVLSNVSEITKKWIIGETIKIQNTKCKEKMKVNKKRKDKCNI
jgi:hypothetical protein